MSLKFSIFSISLLTLLCASLLGCSSGPDQTAKQYYTWEGLEPDRWGSVWLMKRHIDPSASISVVPVGARLRDATAIATPNAPIKRTHGRSTYENLFEAFNQVGDPVLMKIGDIINELEISPWSKSSPSVAVVEKQFRELQYKYNRVDVPVDCYAGFFDALYATLQKSGQDDLEALAGSLEPDTVCAGSKGAVAEVSDTPVLEYPVHHVLNLINANKKVVFVDTREGEEFDEHRIPGAINLKLREVNESIAPQFADADLVISYCIKDFRGYEVALAMSRAGVKNVGIMNPFGLKGWKDTGLPVAGGKVSDEEALIKLKEIAERGV
jgi:rhodanese-related sulfurtransferase